MTELPKLKPSPALANLLMACEKMCRQECCGIGAFDFSPLHVASHMASYKGSITEAEVAAMLGDLDQCLRVALSLGANDQGYLCSIEGINQNFSYAALASLHRTLAAAIRLAPQVLAYCESILAQELEANDKVISI